MIDDDDIFDADDDFSDASQDNNGGFAPLYTLKGEVLRVIYSNTENGYSIIRLKVEKGLEKTLVGTMPNILEGQDIEARGRWVIDDKYGRQFKVNAYHVVLPNSIAGIKRFLASGVLPGIGAVYSERIVDHFGLDTLKILDNAIERLNEVPGIGKKRISEIRQAWQDAGQGRETQIFLQGLDISASYCAKIIAKYGQATAADVVRRNPYRLADDISGIGFQKADVIARKLGIAVDADIRICSGLEYVMKEFGIKGHTCCPEETLLMEAEKKLGVSKEKLRAGLEVAKRENKIISEPVQGGDGIINLMFLRHLYFAETNLAHSIRVILNNAPPPSPLPASALKCGYDTLNDAQRQAVNYAFRYGFSIITGGPGVGKTTVVRQIAGAARSMRMRVCLAAPTGRASKRLGEATGLEAMTIHRLLKWDPREKKFLHNQDKPLDCELLVVDEVSMLDVQLADSLFCAIAPSTRIVLVGDKDQLPSVGPGSVLHDLIQCGKVPVTYLTQVYRQSSGSRIITNAHSVNRGNMPDMTALPNNEKGDFYWINEPAPVEVAKLICRMVTQRIPAVFGFNPVRNIQVLTPMKKGECGTQELNNALQAVLNPPAAGKEEFHVGERIFRVGDKVMQTSNNYDKSVFNGEMGIIVSIDNIARKFAVHFETATVEYQQIDAEQLVLAYAITIHKSQGSEFPVVVMPLLMQHNVMLQKNLVYTGMTRAKKLLIMLGEQRALATAVRNNTPSARLTRLAERIVR